MTDKRLFSFVFQNIVISSAAERVSPSFLLKSKQFDGLSAAENTVVI